MFTIYIIACVVFKLNSNQLMNWFKIWLFKLNGDFFFLTSVLIIQCINTLAIPVGITGAYLWPGWVSCSSPRNIWEIVIFKSPLKPWNGNYEKKKTVVPSLKKKKKSLDTCLIGGTVNLREPLFFFFFVLPIGGWAGLVTDHLYEDL